MTGVMTRVSKRAVSILAAGLSLITLISIGSTAMAGGGPKNVLVVQNSRSRTSTDIASYYVRARKIPQQNLLTINCSTDEIVSRSEFETNVLAPIRDYLQSPENSGRIDYIVVTKAIPLGANYGYSTGPLSVTSVLTCATETGVTAPIVNPYGPTWYPIYNTAFSHSTSFGNKHLYLVTRLDGYTVADVYRLIDGSVSATRNGSALIDATVVTSPTSYVNLNNMLFAAYSTFTSHNVPVVCDSGTNFVGGASGLIAYFGWGSNDPQYSLAAYTSNSFLPGSIADTYVSSSGRTFNPTTGGQSLIADLIPRGACGLSGYISEPYVSFCDYPNVVADRYTRGFNMAESFYAASPELFWKGVIIGDPLMAPFADPPEVSIDRTDIPLTGMATISATATASSGVSKVDFYFEGTKVGSASAAPFVATVDTTQYTVGPHSVEAVAYESSPAAVQGSGTATMIVQNSVSNLSVLSDAFSCVDGQGVHATDKVVSAGTVEMGGGDFYVQEQNHTSGIRVVSTVEVTTGDVVTLEGPLVTDSSERCIFSPTITKKPTKAAEPTPVFMANGSLGGADVGAETKGIADGHGARNIDILVRTFGKVTYVGDDSEPFFYIDDGSHLDDGRGHVGLKVESRTLIKPALNSWTVIRGISGCEDVGHRVVRLLRARRQSDIQIIR